jgi:hypothetical protein
VQAVVTRPSSQPVDPPQPGRLTRLWRLPLAWHAVALLALLLVALAVTMPDRLGHADEGAALSQAELLAGGEGWSTSHPLPAADPEGHAFPIGNSTQRSGTNEFVPFSKHPVYPVVLAPLVDALGVVGGPLLSVLGTVAAALATALLARRLDPALARPALWFLGLATPLWFDSFLTIAHTLGAAAVAFGVLLSTRRDPRAVNVVGGAACFLAAVLLRNEAILLGVALAGVLVVASSVRREPRSLVAGGAVFAATAAGYVLDARLASLTLGGDAVEPFRIDQGGSFVADRLSGFAFTVLAPSDRTATGLLLSTLGLVFVLAAVTVVRRRPEDGNGVLVFLGGAVAVEALRFVVEPDAHVPGLLFAAPLLVGGLALVDRATAVRRDVAIPLATSALFFLAVLATQYSNGGGGGWGGRYFAIALPLVVPVALLAAQRAGRRVPASTRPAAVGLAIAIAAVLVAAQSSSLLVDHRLTERLEATVDAAASAGSPGDGDARPVVVSTKRGLGRLAYRSVLAQRWIEVPDEDEDVVPYLERLHALGVRRVVLVGPDLDEVTAGIAPLYTAESHTPVVVSDPFGRDVVSSSSVVVLTAG